MLFFIRFPSYGMLYHLRNAWVFPLTFVSMEKFSKTNDMGDTWGIDSHNSHKLWLLFHRIPTLWYPRAHEKFMCLFHEFLMAWENTAIFILWVFIVHQIPILWYIKSYGCDMGFLASFPYYG